MADTFDSVRLIRHLQHCMVETVLQWAYNYFNVIESSRQQSQQHPYSLTRCEITQSYNIKGIARCHSQPQGHDESTGADIIKWIRFETN